MINEPMSDYLPQVRCTATLKQRLQRIAGESVARELADHIRYAIEAYVAEEEQRLDLPPIVAPTANTAVTAG